MSFRSSRKAIRFLQSLEDAREQHRAAEDQKRATNDLRAANHQAHESHKNHAPTNIEVYQHHRDEVRKHEIQQKLLEARDHVEKYERYRNYAGYYATYEYWKKKVRRFEEDLRRVEGRGRAEDGRRTADLEASKHHLLGGGATHRHHKETDDEHEKRIRRDKETEALNAVPFTGVALSQYYKDKARKQDGQSMYFDGPAAQVYHNDKTRQGERDGEVYLVAGHEVDAFAGRRRFARNGLPRYGRYFASGSGHTNASGGFADEDAETARIASASALQAYLDNHGHSWRARKQMRSKDVVFGGMLDSNGAIVRSPVTLHHGRLGGSSLWHDEYAEPRWWPFEGILSNVRRRQRRGQNLQIIIDNPNGRVQAFTPGETVSGRVIMDITEVCVLTDASVELWGDSMSSFTFSGGAPVASNHTTFEHVDLFKARNCKFISQPTTVKAGQVYEWPFQFTLPHMTECYRAYGKVEKDAGHFITGPHRLPPSIPGTGLSGLRDREGIMYGLDANVVINKSRGKHLHKRVPIIVSSWLEEDSKIPVLTTRYPLGQWQQWDGPLHQRLFMHFGSSSGSVSPVIDFGAFIDLHLPNNMTKPMSLRLSVRHNQSLIATSTLLPRLVLVEVHLKLQEHWRERRLGHMVVSARNEVGTFHNDTYSHVLPADGTPLVLINEMTFQSFATQSDVPILPTYKSYLRSHVFGLVVEARIRHQLSGHIFKVATEVEWDITAIGSSDSASSRGQGVIGARLTTGSATVPEATLTRGVGPPTNAVIAFLTAGGVVASQTTSSSGSAAASSAVAQSSQSPTRATSNDGPFAASSTTSISSESVISGSSSSAAAAGGASEGTSSQPPLPTAKLSKGSGAANASSHDLSAASSTASIHSGVIGGGRSRSTSRSRSATAIGSTSGVAGMARLISGLKTNSASKKAGAGSQSGSGSNTATSSDAAEKFLGSTLKRSKRSSSPVTAARTIERAIMHKVGGGASEQKPASGKASTESIVSSDPPGSTTEVTTEVVSA